MVTPPFISAVRKALQGMQQGCCAFPGHPACGPGLTAGILHWYQEVPAGWNSTHILLYYLLA